MLNRKHAIVEVSPSRVELALFGARGLLAHRAKRLDAAEWPVRWTDGLVTAEQHLKGFVEELRCVGLRARVVFTSPSAACASASTVGSSTNVERAAHLALTAAAAFAVDEHASGACELESDPCIGRRTRSDGAGTAPAQRHAVAAADMEATLSELFAMIERAGLKPESATPVEAIATSAAVRSLLRDAEPDGARAVIWIGEHVSVLAASFESRLLFARTMGVGLSAFTHALTRPIRVSEDSPEVELSHDEARELLLTAGIPKPNQEIALGRHTGLRGGLLLPVLQPVLQRLSVETKHSLRFSVADAVRAQLTLRAIGPGSHVQGLASWVSRQCGMPMENESAASPDAGMSCRTGAIAAYAAAGPRNVWLVPARHREQQEAAKHRRVLVAGAALAVLTVLGDAGWSWSRLAASEDRLTALRSASGDQEERRTTRDSAAGARLAQIALRSRIDAALGESPDLAGLLSEVSQRTPEDILLTALDVAGRDAKSPHAPSRGSICGYVRAEAEHDQTGVLARYIEELRRSPLLSGVRLDRTQQSMIDGRDVLTFALEVTPVEIPCTAWARHALLAAPILTHSYLKARTTDDATASAAGADVEIGTGESR